MDEMREKLRELWMEEFPSIEGKLYRLQNLPERGQDIIVRCPERQNPEERLKWAEVEQVWKSGVDPLDTVDVDDILGYQSYQSSPICALVRAMRRPEPK